MFQNSNFKLKIMLLINQNSKLQNNPPQKKKIKIQTSISDHPNQLNMVCSNKFHLTLINFLNSRRNKKKRIVIRETLR